MPISPDRMKLYPGGSINSPEWKAIRARILKRAGDRCECACGCRAANHDTHPMTGSFVVLTIAHLDQDETNSADDNLKALCQRCHNRLDAPHRRKNAAKTRHNKRAARDFFEGAPRRP